METHVIARTLLFNPEGEVLLLVRSDDDEHRPGGYDIPGGKIEAEEGEGIFEGALRELYEEAGIIISPHDMYLAYSATKTGFKQSLGRYVNFVSIIFVSQLQESQEAQLSSEHKDAMWLPIEQAIVVSEGLSQERFLRYLVDNKLFSQYWLKEEAA